MYYNTYGYNKYFREDKECFMRILKMLVFGFCGNDVLRNIRFSSKSNTFLKDKFSLKYKMFSNKTCFGFYTMKVCYLNLKTCVCGL